MERAKAPPAPREKVKVPKTARLPQLSVPRAKVKVPKMVRLLQCLVLKARVPKGPKAKDPYRNLLVGSREFLV